MCGIIGYIGDRDVLEVILEGLQRLEYRGYDSAGVAVMTGDDLEVVKSAGKLSNLRDKLRDRHLSGRLGIGHTRWATHGKPSETNAHPHRHGNIVIVHNGIVENYLELKRSLMLEGHEFYSETDTEVIAHLIQRAFDTGYDFVHAVKIAVSRLEGSFALGILATSEPDRFIATKRNSPLVIGCGKDEQFIASDIPAIVNYTREIKHLEDDEIAVVTRQKVVIYDRNLEIVERSSHNVTWSPIMVEKLGYKHFMLKEIHEQPRALIDTIMERVDKSTNRIILEELENVSELSQVSKVVLLGCGTAGHACMVGKFLIEKLARIPVEVDLSSEYRYRGPIVLPDTLVVPISQSGETADTLAAMNEAKGRGAITVAICNVIDSTIARSADHVLFTHAGPEIGVASTKAFTTQLAMLYLLSLYLGRKNGKLPLEHEHDIVLGLLRIPPLISSVLDRLVELDNISHRFFHCRDFLYLGRGINYPIALEGALKLKEISYIHAEGYAAGEMKHGPIALIDEHMPVVVVAPMGSRTHEKILSNLEEAKARNGKVIGIITEGDHSTPQFCDEVFSLPLCAEVLSPLLTVIPLQYLAYSIAVLLGTDVDQPRNLAKSVTVE